MTAVAAEKNTFFNRHRSANKGLFTRYLVPFTEYNYFHIQENGLA
jgi:hypothetical protein